MLLIDKNWLIRIWSDIKGAQDEIIRLLLNVSDCLHVFAWMKFHPRMYLSLSKRQGWNFILEWKEKKKSCSENFCSLKKKGPYPSFLSEQKFSKQYFQKTAFVIISLKFWNNEIPGKISLRWICLVYIYETVNLRGKIEKNGNLFFPFENQFLWFKTKSTFSALYLYLEN